MASDQLMQGYQYSYNNFNPHLQPPHYAPHWSSFNPINTSQAFPLPFPDYHYYYDDSVDDAASSLMRQICSVPFDAARRKRICWPSLTHTYVIMQGKSRLIITSDTQSSSFSFGRHHLPPSPPSPIPPHVLPLLLTPQRLPLFDAGLLLFFILLLPQCHRI